ncbi:PilZ domain-containing protein [Thermodesulfobacteriota bacterium]
MTTSNKQADKSPVITRLIDLVTKMPEGEQYALLNELEDRFSKFKRKNYRKSVKASIEYIAKDRPEKGLTHDISAGGVFIETRMPFRTREDISLNFILPNKSQEQIKINGKIVRATPYGIGVAFKPLNEEQKVLIKSYLEML